MKTNKKFNMKSFFNSKGFYIVFSFLVSFALWTYVTHSENPDVPFTVRNIHVEFLNEETLTDSNLVLTGVDESVVSFQFSGKRNVVTKLSNNNIGLTVDLANVTKSGDRAGVYQLQYKIEYPSGVNANEITVSDASVDYITVTVEKLVPKTVEVVGINDCSIAEGYQSEPMKFEPETITVSGPEAIVGTVDHVQITLDRKNVSRTIQENVDVALVDSDGQIVNTDKLTLSQESVNVTLPVVMVKEVALSVNFVYGASVSESNVSYKIEPSSILIAGDADTLKDTNQINLGTIDLTAFSTTASETMTITVPNDVENLSGETTATVNVEVLGQSSARISATNIGIRNKPEKYEVTVITQSLDILLRGKEESLSKITNDNIRIVADLSELANATGTMSVTAKVYIDGYTDIDAIGEYKISINVT